MFNFFAIPFIVLALLSRSLPVETQIRGHYSGRALLPPPHYGTCFHFYQLSREEFSIFLHFSTRVEPIPGTRYLPDVT